MRVDLPTPLPLPVTNQEDSFVNACAFSENLTMVDEVEMESVTPEVTADGVMTRVVSGEAAVRLPTDTETKKKT